MSHWKIQVENHGELVIATNGKFEVQDISNVPENVDIESKRFLGQHMNHLYRYLQRYGSLNIRCKKE